PGTGCCGAPCRTRSPGWARPSSWAAACTFCTASARCGPPRAPRRWTIPEPDTARAGPEARPPGLPRCRGGSEAGAHAHPDHPRIQLQLLARALAGHAHVRTRTDVAQVGAGEPGRVDVVVQADGADGALGGVQAHVGAVAADGLVAEVGLVVAQAHERAEHVVWLAEVPLGAQRHRLLVDRADLAGAVRAHAVVELVGRAPQLHAEVVGGVPGGADRRSRIAVHAEAVARVGRMQVRQAADHGEPLAGGRVAGL